MFVSYINRYSATDFSSDLKKINVVFQPEKFEVAFQISFFLNSFLSKCCFITLIGIIKQTSKLLENNLR